MINLFKNVKNVVEDVQEFLS